VKNKDIIELTKTYQRVFKSSDGQTVLEDLEKRCNVHHTSFSMTRMKHLTEKDKDK
jgi:uncharacterized protein YbcV (DUF1398 family)